MSTIDTTPRDAIAGLSESLRLISGVMGSAIAKNIPVTVWKIDLATMAEAATAIDALQARVKELEEEAKDKEARYNSLIILTQDNFARATSAEQERDKLQGMLLLCGELGGIGKDETPAAYLRRLIDGLIDAARERDEAYERAAKVAEDNTPRKFEGTLAAHVTGNRIATAIRRLASGPEKEKRE